MMNFAEYMMPLPIQNPEQQNINAKYILKKDQQPVKEVKRVNPSRYPLNKQNDDDMESPFHKKRNKNNGVKAINLYNVAKLEQQSKNMYLKKQIMLRRADGTIDYQMQADLA